MNPTVLIVYFSGTGGTRRIAETFRDSLIRKKCSVSIHSLDRSEYPGCSDDYIRRLRETGLLLLLYPVHAFDAPDPVYEWIRSLPEGLILPAAVISVSGGGEIWPNTSSRMYCKKALKKKGLKVFHEDMMIMPSNVVIPTGDHGSTLLLRDLPGRIEQKSEELLTGREKLWGYRPGARVLRWVTVMEKRMAYRFGQAIYPEESCTGCGWCARSCPRNNITMTGGRPVFDNSCIICMRCLYGCPEKALSLRKYDLFLLKEGFSLGAIEKRMEGIEPDPPEISCRGLLWIGVRRYLKKGFSRQK